MRQGNYLSQRCVGVENQFKLLQGSGCFHEARKKSAKNALKCDAVDGSTGRAMRTIRPGLSVPVAGMISKSSGPNLLALCQQGPQRSTPGLERSKCFPVRLQELNVSKGGKDQGAQEGARSHAPNTATIMESSVKSSRDPDS